MRTIYIAVNGIKSNPSAADGWTDRFCTWINLNTSGASEKFEYHCYALTRRIFQNRRAKNLAMLLAEYHSGIVAVGHSNGCELLCQAIQKTSDVTIQTLHLISPACDADFRKNGLNDALADGKVQRIIVHVAEADKAMRFANLTGKLLRVVGLGYGTMGLDGPKHMDTKAIFDAGGVSRVTVLRYSAFGHSTIFEPKNFESLMRKIAR